VADKKEEAENQGFGVDVEGRGGRCVGLRLGTIDVKVCLLGSDMEEESWK
jgi:hypothetical protein